eukprot:6741817-Prymnesium_polylepis.1
MDARRIVELGALGALALGGARGGLRLFGPQHARQCLCSAGSCCACAPRCSETWDTGVCACACGVWG